MKIEDCGVYIRTDNKNNKTYDIVDETYIKIPAACEFYYVDGATVDCDDTFKDAESIINRLKKEYTKDNKIDYKELEKNEDYKYELRTYNKNKKILEVLENMKLDGLYIKVSTLECFLLFTTLKESYFVPYTNNDTTDKIIDKLKFCYSEYSIKNLKFKHFKSLGKKFINENFLEKEILFFMDNVNSFFTNESKTIKYASKTYSKGNGKNIDSSYNNIIAAANQNGYGKKGTNTSTLSRSSSSWNSESTTRTIVTKINSCLVNISHKYDFEFEEYLRDIYSTVQSELKRMQIMCD